MHGEACCHENDAWLHKENERHGIQDIQIKDINMAWQNAWS